MRAGIRGMVQRKDRFCVFKTSGWAPEKRQVALILKGGSTAWIDDLDLNGALVLLGDTWETTNLQAAN